MASLKRVVQPEPARPPTVEPGLAPFVRRLAAVSSYFEAYRSARNGSFRCYKHPRVTHYGTLAYLIPINGFLLERTGEERYLERALAMIELLRGQLRTDEGRFIFAPGRLNPYNASNNAIDSGIAADSLCGWYERFAAVTRPDLCEFIRDACSKVAETYLRTAGGKLTNQSLWAMTGLAAVYRSIERKEEYRATCLEAVKQAFRDQNADGSFPYLPRRLQGEDHASLHDVSGFYHSRHLCFLFDVGDKLEYDFDENESERLLAGGDFLCALYSARGRKSLQVEAKHWYWMADGDHEWASACFDYHALSEAHRRWGRPEHLRVAGHAARNLLENADADGSVTARGGDRDFQCTHFWSAHFAWVAKALDAYVPELPRDLSAQPFRYEGRESGVVSVRDRSVNLQLRSRKPPLTLLFGSYACSVTELSVVDGGRWSENLLPRRRWSLAAPGEIFAIPLGGLLRSLLVEGRKLFRDRREYRFALALVHQSVLSGRWRHARMILADVLLRRTAFLLLPVHSSLWCLESKWNLDDGTHSIEGRLSRPDGSSRIGARFEKRMTLGVREMNAEVRLRSGAVAGLFLLPASDLMTDLAVDVPARRALGGLLFRLPASAEARARYRIRYADAVAK
ncbi:MAG: hypothetical protein ACREQQ_13595 [Candidatus Binatia bacterium]